MNSKINSKDVPCRKKPCKNCPFRKDSLKNWLPHRIEDDLKVDTFVCHKNTKLQCAGHMLLLGNENKFVRLAKAFKIDLKLTGRELIFDSKEDCINHHINE